MDSKERQRRRELERRRRNEEKDLQVERTPGPRPLEGLAGGHTTWTGAQDDHAAPEVHGDDERRSREQSEEQVRRLPK
jgi:hypothetical protein